MIKMKDLPDVIERHVIYFLTGFVAIVSSCLLAFSLYVFLFAPILFLGGYYFLIVPGIAAGMYYIGRRMLKGECDGN